jgi:hypothetical protein
MRKVDSNQVTGSSMYSEREMFRRTKLWCVRLGTWVARHLRRGAVSSEPLETRLDQVKQEIINHSIVNFCVRINDLKLKCPSFTIFVSKVEFCLVAPVQINLICVQILWHSI